tara:strand:- start:4 stop:1212 length:1209 start_codon:yes stop_codon:yes gene_type:complete
MKELCIYTAAFPFGKGETFLESEIMVLAEKFDVVHVFPSVDSGVPRSVPENVKIHNIFIGFDYNSKHSSVFVKNFFWVLYVFITELKNARVTENKYREKLHYTLSFFARSKVLYDYLCKENLTDKIHYTYWMDFWATCFSFINIRKNIKFISRAHRYDLYEGLNSWKYIHFRSIHLKKVHKVYCVSEDGQKYLQNKYPKYKDKIGVSFLGTNDNGVTVFTKEDKLRIVTCSNVVSVKRVSLMIDILKEVTMDVEWVHFGDGKLFEEVKARSAELSHNIQCIFKGRKTNKEVLEYYTNNCVDLFVNVSESEGLPVSIMEAISFGVPIIATNVGGTSEIVCKKTGWLIEKDFAPKEVSKLIEGNFEKVRDAKFCAGVRKFWQENFNAKENYERFIVKLLNESQK